MSDLFESAGMSEGAPRPLADRLRPQKLTEVVGQDHLVGPEGTLTRMLQDITHSHPPPRNGRFRAKLRYAHLGGSNPPTVVIHGNRTESLPNSYQRYLENRFRELLKIEGSPIRLELKSGDNPYEGRKNQLTDRQIKRKRRMMKHVKK